MVNLKDMVKRCLATESEMDISTDVRIQFWVRWMEIWISIESTEKRKGINIELNSDSF